MDSRWRVLGWKILYSEILSFFSTNEGAADDIAVWEAFKVYIRDILISQQKFRVHHELHE